MKVVSENRSNKKISVTFRTLTVACSPTYISQRSKVKGQIRTNTLGANQSYELRAERICNRSARNFLSHGDHSKNLGRPGAPS